MKRPIQEVTDFKSKYTFEDLKHFETKSPNEVENYLKIIITEINSMKKIATNRRFESFLETERKFAAAVLDRFFFSVSFVYMIICLVSFILANRNFWLFT